MLEVVNIASIAINVQSGGGVHMWIIGTKVD